MGSTVGRRLASMVLSRPRWAHLTAGLWPATGRDFESAFDVLLTFHIVKVNLICGVTG